MEWVCHNLLKLFLINGHLASIYSLFIMFKKLVHLINEKICYFYLNTHFPDL